MSFTAAEKKVRAVIFDLDGVICDTEPLHIESWHILFAREGIDVSDAELEAGIGITDLNLLEGIFAIHAIEADPREWQQRKRTIYLSLLKKSVNEFHGATALIRKLSARWHLAIASSAWRAAIEAITDRLGVRDYFSIIVGKEDVSAHKPSPEPFLAAADGLGIKPLHCAVIEDSPTGLQAAKAAGMRRIAVTNSFPATRLQDAELVVESLEETERIEAFLLGRI